ncbi:MAG: zinc ribbon domain-containing protein [Prevotella sp.]|nr:zinc ribbon domain-containing protein [Prevotella sp.]MBQ7426381.1 zinc ribbon domain-containing protein [Prevotella sp.]MBR0264696.1 zinc ribbon domain-containing protein [Prevotella sp.]
MRKLSVSFLICFLSMMLAGCYNRGPITPDAWDLTAQQLDSISFYTTHHYTQNYNFVVTGDSLVVVAQQPEDMAIPDVVSSEIETVGVEMQKDSITLRKNEHIVVADIKTVPADTIDSVWVKVARDQLTFGWIHENELLAKVSPDDPISQFIDFFSDAHMLIFLAFCVVVVAAYGVRRLMKRGAKIVHFNDIPSFYPTTLCLLIASSAVLYSSIQLFGPESWRHFYYHPSLNPFALPLHLGLFVSSVWAIVIVAIATVDDVTKKLPLGAAVLYLSGLTAVCAVCYVVFSITTLYYIGYPLLIAYYVFAIKRLLRLPSL